MDAIHLNENCNCVERPLNDPVSGNVNHQARPRWLPETISLSTPNTARTGLILGKRLLASKVRSLWASLSIGSLGQEGQVYFLSTSAPGLIVRPFEAG